MLDEHRKYWDSFYASRVSADVPVDPSPFARWVSSSLEDGQLVAEFGFGNARDSLWFALAGHEVMGFDFAHSAVEHATARASDLGVSATFSELDLYEEGDVKASGDAIIERQLAPAIYGRFLIHSLEDAGRHHLLDLSGRTLERGGALFLEFRTGQDKDARHEFGEDHYRHYLDPELVAEEIGSRGGRVTHLEAGHGLAPYKTEDPHVARIVARWSEN
jgi:SAM-dependent methyltransferase